MSTINIKQNSFWLKNAHLPSCLIKKLNLKPQTRENLCLCDLQVENGILSQIMPASPQTVGIDLQRKIVLPCFVDLHTHLDKGHIVERSPNLRGDFQTALSTVQDDAQHWQAEDLYPRMEFGLKCSYAHGTIAIRTHLDSDGKQADITWQVWQELQQKWQDKITLQAVSLVSLDYFTTDEGVTLADKVAKYGGILGGVAYTNPQLDRQLERVFQLAKERNLDLDFHCDENGEIDSNCLEKIAKTAIKYQFQGQIICGHCCSLAVQPLEQVKHTIELVKQANIAIVSLPLCNLYLQDRNVDKTPIWRGVTRVHELKQAGVFVAFANDNCRDPFFGFGDHDMLEVFNQSVRICHLDTPYSDWITSVNQLPADLMNLPSLGRFQIDSPANFIIFNARYFSELLSRPQSDRQVIRHGKLIDSTLPDYAELDYLINN